MTEERIGQLYNAERSKLCDPKYPRKRLLFVVQDKSAAIDNDFERIETSLIALAAHHDNGNAEAKVALLAVRERLRMLLQKIEVTVR